MNLRAVARMLGIVLLLVAGFMLVPAAVGTGQGEVEPALACLWSALASAAVGGALALVFRGSAMRDDGRPDYFRREGLATVGLAWLVVGLAGALPFHLSGTFDSFTDCLFESVSGFTTTGSTVLPAAEIDGLSHTIAFWRSFTHWLGGFGIVMVFVVLFPTGGRNLFRSEVPGISREAGHSRVRDSALTLLKIYVGLSLIEFLLLLGTGIGVFDAAIHTFGTIATGGFSSHSDSVGHFASLPVELVVTLFMFLCGFNFAIYDTLLRVGPRPAWRALVGSLEARTYVGLAVGATLVVATVLWLAGGTGPGATPEHVGLGRSVRDAGFQVVCLLTSTGYGTADFDTWPQFCRVVLMCLAVVGACAGSTGGGLKVVRVLIVLKAAMVGIRRFIRPRAVHAVRIDGQALSGTVVASVTGYFALWIAVLVLGTLFVAGFGHDLETAATAVLATLNNIGPGLNAVGPAANFSAFEVPVKLLLTVCMILGRLEFYAVVALLVPSFWRR